jgi:hypothetical protein
MRTRPDKPSKTEMPLWLMLWVTVGAGCGLLWYLYWLAKALAPYVYGYNVPY